MHTVSRLFDLQRRMINHSYLVQGILGGKTGYRMRLTDEDDDACRNMVGNRHRPGFNRVPALFVAEGARVPIVPHFSWEYAPKEE